MLVRTRGYQGGKSWLLIKHRDEAASTADIATEAPRSVVSDRLLAEIAFEEGGDVRHAVSADPPSGGRGGARRSAYRQAQTQAHPAVWHSNRPQ